ncbi:MAG: low temperature requirement protein A [Anaerolineae bacterium]
MARRQWWQRPQLRVGEDERRVSWLELFFDLVFVVVISQLAHHLAEHLSLSDFFGYVLQFIAVWWVWIGGTYYNERFETHDLSYRLFVFLMMLPPAAMAVFASEGLDKASAQFALAYVVARILIIALWLNGGYHNPIFRPVSNRYAIGFSVSALIWLISVFVPPPMRYALWGVGLVIDFLTPITTLNWQAKLPQSKKSKLPERYGLFVIIVLGEAIVGVINGVANVDVLTLNAGVTGVLGMALIFGLWWVYFDFIGRREGARRGIWYALIWGYTHAPLVVAIAAVSAGIQNVLAHQIGELQPGVRLLTAGAVAAALASMALIELVSRREPDEPTGERLSPLMKTIAAVVCLLIGLFGGGMSSTLLLLTLIVLVATQVVYAAYVWFAQVIPEDHPAAHHG